MLQSGLKKVLTAFVLFFALFVIAGCNLKPTTTTGQNDSPESVGGFNNYAEIKEYLKLFYDESKGSYVSRFATFDSLAPNAESTATDGPTGSSSGRTYSTTNNQVDGVMESDTFLTDGYFLYVTTEQTFRLIDADTLDILFTYEIEQGYVHGLYRFGNKIVLIAYEYTIKNVEEQGGRDYYFWSYYLYSTKVVVFDATDKNDVTVERELSFANTYLVQSRMIGSMLYLVLDNYQINYGFDEENFIPEYKDSVLGEDLLKLPAENIYFMPNGNQTIGYLMLASLDVEESDPADVKAYLGSSYQIYMSLNNLYSIVYRYDYDEETQVSTYSTIVLRFEIDPSSKTLSFKASQKIAGSPLNQFSMDEYDGVFRIATTHWVWGPVAVASEPVDSNETGDETTTDTTRTTIVTEWRSRIENQLYLLDATAEGEMTQIGVIEGIGKPGESIYAVRYNGPIAYVVTFVRTDPMYKFDLSDPANPVELGAYYEDGVSDYLHIINDNLLLGVGRQAEEKDGWTRFTGVKIGLYQTAGDTPLLSDQYLAEGEYSWTSVGYDHKAFIYYPLSEEGVVYFAIPVFEYSRSGLDTYYWNYSQNLFLFKVTIATEDLEFLGKISHLDPVDDDRWWYWFDSIDRAVMIEDRIYTVSRLQIRVHTFMNGIEEVDHLILDEPAYNYYPTAEDGATK